MTKIFLSIVIMLQAFLGVFARDEFSVEYFLATKELPISEITEIFFGERGMLWIGTNNGLYYFDGHNYGSQIPLNFTNSTLFNNRINDISQDSEGNLWLVTEFGIENFNIDSRLPTSVLKVADISEIYSIHNSLESYNLFFTRNNLLLSINSQTSLVDTIYIAESQISGEPLVLDSNVWLAQGGKLTSIDLLTDIVESVELPVLSDLSSIIIKQADPQNILLAIGYQLFNYNISSKKISKQIKLPDVIVDFKVKDSGEIVIATNNKVFYLDRFFNSEIHIEQLVFLPNEHIQNVLFDNNGFIWLASNVSILKINPYSKIFKYSSFLKEKQLVFESTKQGVVYQERNSNWFFYHSILDKTFKLPISECKSACLLDENLYIGNSSGLYRTVLNSSGTIRKEIVNNLLVNSLNIVNDKLWLASDQGLFILSNDTINKICSDNVWDFLVKDNKVYVITEDGFGVIDPDSCALEILIPDLSIKGNSSLNDVLQSYDGKTWIATEDGLFQFDPSLSEKIDEQFRLIHEEPVYALIEAADLPEIWFSSDVGLGAVNYTTDRVMIFSYEDGIKQQSFIKKGAFHGKGGSLSFITEEQMVNFLPEDVYRNNTPPEVIISMANYVSKDTTENKPFFLSDTIVILPHIRFLQLELTTFDYYSPRNTVFYYSLESEGEKSNWHTLENKNSLTIGSLIPGVYDLKLKAINNHGVESDQVRSFTLIVKAHLLQTKWAYFIYLLTVIFMVVLLIRVRTRNLRRVNREYKDKERIAKEIELQKEELTQKNKNITDSINYARRIQLAMMPSDRLFSTIFPDSFILHMPKDIVSGDFYWINKVGSRTFFSAVDCTGHGVPGAFMSIIGVELFRRITEIEKISTPAEVLNSLSRNFERVFGDVDEMKLRDGMDLAFCTLNEEQTMLEFAGAFNPLYIVRDSSIMEIKGDRHSVGVYEDDDNVRSFNNHVIPLQDGDIIYIFTDGFADQFGGPDGKKYKYRRFRHLLLALHQLPMHKQKEFLRKSIMEWKGELDQVDDILVVGLRINSSTPKE